MVDKGQWQTEIHYIEGVVQWDLWGLFLHPTFTNISFSSTEERMMKILKMLVCGTSNYRLGYFKYIGKWKTKESSREMIDKTLIR